MKTIITTLLVSIIAVNSMYAQISEGGKPFSFTKKFSKLNPRNIEVPTYVLPEINNAEQIQKAQRAKEQCNCEKGYYGTGISVDINLLDVATPNVLKDGSKLWRYKFKSESAHSLSFYFDKFQVPQGAKLFFYNTDKSMVLGAFTNKNEGKFATQPIIGNEIIIEYYEPANVTNTDIHIFRVIHDFLGFFPEMGPYGNSGSCEVDVNCPTGYGWEKEARAVSLMLIYDTGWNLQGFCSGALLNNQLQDGSPYYLTAQHCLDGNSDCALGGVSDTDPAYCIFVFNHQTNYCDGDDMAAPTTMSITGATLLWDGAITEYAWLQLSSTPPSSYNVCYAGWDKNSVYPTTPVTGIHHPAGDVKKICVEYDTPLLIDNPICTGYTNSHWLANDWDIGSTTGGSSGSPLFNSAHRVVGSVTASNGYTECDPLKGSSYGRFDGTWTDGDLNLELDPSNTGITTLDTYCPVNYCGFATLTTSSGTITDGSGGNNYSNMSNCKWLIQPSAAGVNSITLNFSAFNTENGYDSIIVYDGSDYWAPVLGSFTGTSLPPSVTSTGCEMFIRFISDESVTAPGFSANYTTNIPCSGQTNLTAASGSITDGSGANDYGCSADCKWLIQPSGATSITLNFTSFSTENGYDFVKIYDGSTTASPLLGSYSGTSLPPTQTSSGGSMLVHFTSDGSVQQGGFSANYTATGNAPVANFTANTTSGTAPLTVNFDDLSSNSPTTWSWSFTGATLSSSTSQNPTNIVYNSSGTYAVTLTASNSWGNDTETKTNYITVNSPVGISENTYVSNFSVYPNPNPGLFMVEFTTLKSIDIRLKVLNVLGQEVFDEATINAHHGAFIKQIDLRTFSKGVYTLLLQTSGGQITQKIIVE